MRFFFRSDIRRLNVRVGGSLRMSRREKDTESRRRVDTIASAATLLMPGLTRAVLFAGPSSREAADMVGGPNSAPSHFARFVVERRLTARLLLPFAISTYYSTVTRTYTYVCSIAL